MGPKVLASKSWSLPGYEFCPCAYLPWGQQGDAFFPFPKHHWPVALDWGFVHRALDILISVAGLVCYMRPLPPESGRSLLSCGNSRVTGLGTLPTSYPWRGYSGNRTLWLTYYQVDIVVQRNGEPSNPLRAHVAGRGGDTMGGEIFLSLKRSSLFKPRNSVSTFRTV